MQRQVLKNIPALITILLLLCSIAQAQNLNYHLAKADSLFQQKRYTQSLELYQSIFQQKQFTPAMLLKMAFIEEGLDHQAKALYYLQSYYQVTRDERAQAKIIELAERYKLTGFEQSDKDRIMMLYQDMHTSISFALAALMIMITSIMVYRKSKKQRPIGWSLVMLITGIILLTHINIPLFHAKAIVSQSDTYLMSGPSAGASVIQIIQEGHCVKVVGQSDVWTKVKWNEKDVYIKQDNLLKLHL